MVRGEEKRVKQRIFAVALCAVLFALCFDASAQQPKKVPRIGYIYQRDRISDSTRIEAIQLGLRELGYIEGENVAFEYRYANGKRGVAV